MTTPNNGGPAFPALNFIVPHDLAEAGVRRLGETQGMTKREEFAMAALQGLCANPAVFAQNAACGWKLVNATEEWLAGYCYELADAMLAARGAP